MIWVALHYVIAFVLKLVVPPEAKAAIRKINVNAPCPGCGHTKGHIRSVEEAGRMVVQHSCHVCYAAWNESPVVRVQQGTVLKPVANQEAA